MHPFKMLNRFLNTSEIVFAAGGSMDWIGCGSEYGHTSWIGLDWVSEFVDWVGLDLRYDTIEEINVDSKAEYTA